MLMVTVIFIEEVIKLRTKSRLLTYLVTISVLAVFPVSTLTVNGARYRLRSSRSNFSGKLMLLS